MVCEDRKMLLEEMTARLDGVHDREGFFVHNGPAEGRVLEGAGEEVERLVASFRMWFGQVLLRDLGDDRGPEVLRCVRVEAGELA